jgi:hypothetical protein
VPWHKRCSLRCLSKTQDSTGNMSEAPQSTATILKFWRRPIAPARSFVPLAKTLELYSPLYPTTYKMILLVESWLFAAQRDGMGVRNPEYIAALRRATTALRLSKTVEEAIAVLRAQEARSASA